MRPLRSLVRFLTPRPLPTVTVLFEQAYPASCAPAPEATNGT